VARVATKPSAGARTVDMFSGKTQLEATEAAAEVVAEAEKGDFVPIHQAVNDYREQAFKVQEWTTKYFGRPEETEKDEYRVSRKGDHLYLEHLKKAPGSKTNYGYAGYMFHKNNFINAARAMAEAARELIKEEAGKK
jgi:hypothetical protein